MRAIKFRAWNSKFNEMMDCDALILNGCYLGAAGKGFVFVHDDFEQATKLIPMQFTGLLDKNGKEIYEGDLMQYKYYNVYKRWWSNTEQIPIIEEECKKQREDIKTHQPVEIIFRDGLFRLDWPITGDDIARGQRFKRGRSHSCDTEEKQFDFEVIGNIYQNPDLLK